MYERIEALDKRVRSKENKYLKRQEDEQEDDKEEAADFEVTIQSTISIIRVTLNTKFNTL